VILIPLILLRADYVVNIHTGALVGEYVVHRQHLGECMALLSADMPHRAGHCRSGSCEGGTSHKPARLAFWGASWDDGRHQHRQVSKCDHFHGRVA
jgi:hypothetical protein